MKNKKIISLTAMSLVLGSTIATANASGGVNSQLRKPAAISVQDRQAEQAAIEAGDYAAWKTAVEQRGDSYLLTKVDAGNFSLYAQAMKLQRAGDREGARTLLEGLGLKVPDGEELKGLEVSEEQMAALELSIKNSDYNAWKTVLEKVESDLAETYLTEENFNIIVRAYKLKASGDAAGAMNLLRDASIPGFLLMPGEVMHGGQGEIEGMSEDKLAQLASAYQNADYAAWKKIMDERGGGKILEIVNAENFAQFARAKVLQTEGKMTEAKSILDQLGFPFQERAVRMSQVASTAASK